MKESELTSPLGLIAGNGTFPLEFAANARARGFDVVAAAHSGETDPAIAGLVSACSWVKVGEVGRIIDILKAAGVRYAAFAGGIKKVNLFGGIKLDLRGIMVLSRVRSTKDDAVLRGVAEELEKSGIRVFSASVFLEKSVAKRGAFTERRLSASEAGDALIGWEAAREIGRLDIGQAVAVAQGVVVAVEAVEGTDAAIKRAGELGGKGGVLVKLAKPQQDLRIDLPTVGPRTIHNMAEAGLSALVLEASKSLILEPDEVARAASRHGIAIFVAESEADLREGEARN